MSSPFCRCTLLIMLFVLANGCDRQSAPPVVATDDSAPRAADSSPTTGPSVPATGEEPMAGDAAKPSDDQLIAVANWEEVEQEIADAGVPVVLDVWSTSCVPCMQEFPSLVALQSRYDDDRLRCISFCVDYIGLKNKAPATYIPKAAEFLRGVEAEHVENYLSETPDADVFSELDIPSLPAVLVFGADGKLEKKFVDVGSTAGFTYETAVVPFVEELIGAPGE